MLSCSEIQIIIKRLDQMDEKFAIIDKKFEMVFERFEIIQNILLEHSHWMKEHEEKNEKMFKQMRSEHRKDYQLLKRETDELKRRNDLIEERMNRVGKVFLNI